LRPVTASRCATTSRDISSARRLRIASLKRPSRRHSAMRSRTPSDSGCSQMISQMMQERSEPLLRLHAHSKSLLRPGKVILRVFVYVLKVEKRGENEWRRCRYGITCTTYCSDCRRTCSNKAPIEQITKQRLINNSFHDFTASSSQRYSPNIIWVRFSVDVAALSETIGSRMRVPSRKLVKVSLSSGKAFLPAPLRVTPLRRTLASSP